MPIAAEATVIYRLSRMPSLISCHRPVKFGGKNAAKKRAPRGSPSQRRVQFTSIVPTASARYTTALKPNAQRSQARLISGGFLHWRKAKAGGVLRGSPEPSHSVPVVMGLAVFQGDIGARPQSCFVVILGLANRRRPIFFAVNCRQHLGSKTVWRTIVNDLTKLQANNPFGK